jgi:hypothetical protein
MLQKIIELILLKYVKIIYHIIITYFMIYSNNIKKVLYKT